MIPDVKENKRQEKQQNQIKNRHYLRPKSNVCLFVLKILNEKVKIASDKKTTKQNDLHFNRKNIGPVFIDKN